MHRPGFTGTPAQTFPRSTGFHPAESREEPSETVWPCHIWSHVTPSPAWTTLSVESRVTFVGANFHCHFIHTEVALNLRRGRETEKLPWRPSEINPSLITHTTDLETEGHIHRNQGACFSLGFFFSSLNQQSYSLLEEMWRGVRLLPASPLGSQPSGCD